MALLTFAKLYGIQNTPKGRQLAHELADRLVEKIKEKVGARSAFEAQILFDDRMADRPGFRLKVGCRSSAALAKALDLPVVEGRRGRTVGGRDAVVVDVRHGPKDVDTLFATTLKHLMGTPVRTRKAKEAPVVEAKPVETPVVAAPTVTEAAPQPAPVVAQPVQQVAPPVPAPQPEVPVVAAQVHEPAPQVTTTA